MAKPRTSKRQNEPTDSDLMREAMGEDAPIDTDTDIDDDQEPADQTGQTGPADPSDPSGQDELVRQLRDDLEQAVAARQRALADYANYQRRAVENEHRARIDGTVAVVRSLLSVLDNFELALGQDLSAVTVEQLADGLGLVQDEMTRALEQHDVTRIDPEPGEEFDPNFHEAMYKQPTDDWPPNSVVEVLQCGYALGEMVLRAAKVAISASAE